MVQSGKLVVTIEKPRLSLEELVRSQAEKRRPGTHRFPPDGEFPWQRIVDYAKASGRSKELDALLADSPNERVLVIFGAGHLGWLQHDFPSDPSIRLRKLAEFAR